MEMLIDLDLYQEQCAQADDTDGLLSVFKETLANFGFELKVFHLVSTANGLIPELRGTIKFDSSAEGLLTSSNYNQDQVTHLAHLASAQSAAFLFCMNQERSVTLISSGDPIEGVCIPMRGRYGSFAIALAKIKNNRAEMSSHVVESIGALGTAFYKSYCARTESSNTEMKLTRKEVNVLRLVSRGETKRSIAETMGVTNHAIDFHYRNIMRKYNTSRIVVAVVKAVKRGVI